MTFKSVAIVLAFLLVFTTGCLRGIRYEKEIRVTITSLTEPDVRHHYSKDGWHEVLRVRLIADGDLTLGTFGLRKIGDFPDYKVLSAAMVVRDLVREVVDYRYDEFRFRSGIQLSAGVPVVVSFDMRVLPSRVTHGIGLQHDQISFVGAHAQLVGGPEWSRGTIVIYGVADEFEL